MNKHVALVFLWGELFVPWHAIAPFFCALMNVNNCNVAEYKFKTFLLLKVFSLTL